MTARAAQVQRLYGITIRTPWPVVNLPACADGPCDVEFVEGAADTLDEAAAHVAPQHAGRWAQSAVLPDGSQYRRWTNLFEFVVSPNGRLIQARALKDANPEAFQAYLLVEALLFSMIRLGREPLHATAVLTDRGVVAFLGESGHGKSTLGAAFVRQGDRLVTDDMLVLTPAGAGFLAHPGPPRMKLYRHIKDHLFGDCHPGMPMNPQTKKLVIPLDAAQTIRQAQPLVHLYLVAPGRHGVTAPAIDRLSLSDALPGILANTAGHWSREPDRLRTQFEFVTRLIRRVAVSRLTYPRALQSLPAVRDAVLADVSRSEPSLDPFQEQIVEI